MSGRGYLVFLIVSDALIIAAVLFLGFPFTTAGMAAVTWNVGLAITAVASAGKQ